MPKRSHKCFLLSEKVESSWPSKKKNLYAETATIYGKNDFSTCEIVKKEKEIHVSFAIACQTAKFMATVTWLSA